VKTLPLYSPCLQLKYNTKIEKRQIKLRFLFLITADKFLRHAQIPRMFNFAVALLHDLITW
jgi:hypothetical protein